MQLSLDLTDPRSAWPSLAERLALRLLAAGQRVVDVVHVPRVARRHGDPIPEDLLTTQDGRIRRGAIHLPRGDPGPESSGQGGFENQSRSVWRDQERAVNEASG